MKEKHNFNQFWKNTIPIIVLIFILWQKVQYFRLIYHTNNHWIQNIIPMRIRIISCDNILIHNSHLKWGFIDMHVKIWKINSRFSTSS